MSCQSATNCPTANVWILTNAPSSYQIELLSAVADQNDVRIKVRFLRDIAGAGPERRFPHQICRTSLALTHGDELRLHGQPIREAAFGQADLYILSGMYTSVTFLMCAWLLHCRKKTWAIWWERPHSRISTFARRTCPGRWLHGIKDSIRRWLLRSADLVIGVGSAAVREYAAMGVHPARLKMLPYCCDVSRFAEVSTDRRDRLRRELGWQNHLVFLFSGQIIPRKGVDILLPAFIRLAQLYSDVSLLLLGEGSDRQLLEKQIPATMRDRIRFMGHLPQSQLPEHFATADVFVFPSRHDGWAVVLNEACGAGLPIIATNQTGAAYDLVVEGENGFRVEANDGDAFFTAMNWCASHRERLSSMGQRSRELVGPFDAVQGAKTLVQHVRSSLGAE